MAKNTIEVKLLGDNKDLKRALDGSGADVESFGSKAGRAFRTGALALGAMGVGAAIAVPKLLNSGATLEAIGVKSSTVFGDSLDDVRTWADGVAASMGLTDTELIGAAASFGDLLKPMGFTADQAAAMSTDMLDLSGALSAWSGGQVSATDAADVLSKAMLGERDGLKALGISITEADVSARLLKNGQEGLTGAALEQAKAVATQQLILEKSTDAQAAWNDGSMDGIKAQNEASAAVGELKEEFIKGIYPALQKMVPILRTVATWVGDNLPAAFAAAESVGRALGDAASWIGNNLNIVLPIVTGVALAIAAALIPAFLGWAAGAGAAAVATLAAAAPFIAIGVAIAAVVAALVWAYQNWEGFRNVVDGVASFLTDTVWPAIQDFADFVGDVFTATVGFIRTHWSTIQSVIKGVWDFVAKYVENVIKIVQGIIQTVTSIIKGDWSRAWDGIKKIFSGVWDQIKHVVSAAIGVVKSVLSAAWPVIRSVLASAWDAMKRKVSDSINGIVGYVRALPGRARNALSSILSTLVGRGKDLITGLKNGMIDKFNDTRAWVGQIPSRILGAISGAYTLLGSVGRNIIIGLKNGMIGKWNEVTAWIRSRISSLSSIARKVLGINSPSKVFAKIGEGVGEGMVMGLDSMTGKVQNAASKMMPSASDLATSVEFGASRLAPAPRSSTTTNATSPQGRPIVLNLAGMAQIKAIVSESDAELLATLEGGLR